MLATPFEWVYAPTLPISSCSFCARRMTSDGKMRAERGWDMRAGYSTSDRTCGWGRRGRGNGVMVRSRERVVILDEPNPRKRREKDDEEKRPIESREKTKTENESDKN